MSSSKRETILAAAAAALASTTGVSGRVYRSRVEALARSEMPALIVEPVQDVSTQNAIGRIEWTLTFQVAVLIRDPGLDSAADPIIVSVHSKLMSDPTLQGLVTILLPTQSTFHFTEADQPQGVIILQYHASYQTVENDLTS